MDQGMTVMDDWVEAVVADAAAETFPMPARLGDEKILIFKIPTGFRGVETRCPHQFAPMKTGILAGNGTMIRCPLHNFIFRLTDGSPVNCKGYRLKVYEIRREDGRFSGRAVA